MHNFSDALFTITSFSTADRTKQQTDLKSALYVLATPIGNIYDITLRALHILSLVNVVACEDTRHTACLLNHYGIKQTLISAHEHNERNIAIKIIERLKQNERIALVSDAGTPTISDPGSYIIKKVRAAGLTIIPIPGVSAVTTALSISGLNSDQFYFVGFLPNKLIQRNQILKRLIYQPATLIFYEAPHRIIETVKILSNILGALRNIVLARELTKLFETIHHCKLGEAVDWLTVDTHRTRGEFVILVQGANKNDKNNINTEEILNFLLTELPELSIKKLTYLAAKITGVKKNTLYKQAIQIKNLIQHNKM